MIKKKPLYVFIHNPKTGGTTIAHYLTKHMGKGQYLAFYPEIYKDEISVIDKIKSLSEKEMDSLNIIWGHRVFYGIDKYFNEREVRYIIFLRSPVERLYSMYNYLFGLSEEGKINEGQKKLISENGKIFSFKEFIEKKTNLQNGFIYQIITSNNLKYGQIESTARIEYIKHFLDKMYFVGLTENKEDFRFLLEILGFDDTFEDQNISKKYIIREEKYDKDIVKRNTEDVMIYNYAKKLNIITKNKIHGKAERKSIIKILKTWIKDLINTIPSYTNKNRHRIIIFGLVKTGTTALFYKIRKSLPYDTVEFFEPKTYINSPADKNISMLAKVLVNQRNYKDYLNCNQFDKKVMLIRDPRDRIISVLIYSVIHSDFYNDEGKMNIFIDRLRQKENDPLSVSVRDLLILKRQLRSVEIPENIGEKIGDMFKKMSLSQIEFQEKTRNVFLFKYEDMIDKKLSGLEKYLGITLTVESDVPRNLDRVVSTKGYGNWRNWFTREDVEFFKPIVKDHMEKYGYDFDDWKLNENPKILPEHCSEYIERIVKEKIQEDLGNKSMK